MHSKKIILTLLLNAFCVTPAALAMCTRTSAVKNTLSRAASARFSTVKPPVAQVSTATLPPVQKPTLTPQLSDARDDKKNRYRKYQESWQQAGAKDAIKKALGITGAAAIATIIAKATEIAECASKDLLFDESLIPDEFSRAIVRIYSETRESRGQGTGFIVASEKVPGTYFLFTAAHCISHKNYAHIRYPQQPGRSLQIELAPLVINPNTDTAVLLIPSKEISRFRHVTNTALPAIPAKQLADKAPIISERIALIGFPGNDAYRGKDVYVPHIEECIVYEPYKTTEQTLTKCIRSKRHLPEEALSGASGSPYIAIQGNRPEIQGIHASGDYYSCEDGSNVRARTSYVGGCGELPHYLQEAEKRAHELQETLQKAERKKSLLRRFSTGSFR